MRTEVLITENGALNTLRGVYYKIDLYALIWVTEITINMRRVCLVAYYVCVCRRHADDQRAFTLFLVKSENEPNSMLMVRVIKAIK